MRDAATIARVVEAIMAPSTVPETFADLDAATQATIRTAAVRAGVEPEALYATSVAASRFDPAAVARAARGRTALVGRTR